MSRADTRLAMLVVLSLAAHAGVAVAAWRRPGDARPVAALNLPVALGTFAYWVSEWRLTVTLGRAWHPEDWFVPLFALAAAALAAGTLARWWPAAALNWAVLAVHGGFLVGMLLVGVALETGRGFF